MKIRLVSHASVIVQTPDVSIWSDPWLFGKAFNDSWTLLPPASFAEELLDSVDYLWISHEHPDHFHIPSLKSLPPAFKERVTVLFQENNSDKMFEAFGRLGFKNCRALPHRETVSLTPGTRVYSYQVGQMDSCLAVMNQNFTALNVNDAELNAKDCHLIAADIGSANVVLNQFAPAGYIGLKDRAKHLPMSSRWKLESLSSSHRELGAKFTFPFASFIYFSNTDNRYMNEYLNRPRDVVEFLSKREQQTIVLYPGDVYDSDESYDSTPALARFDQLYGTFGQLEYADTPPVDVELITAAFHELTKQLFDRYPKICLRMLRPVVVYLPDIDKTLEFSIRDGAIQVIESDIDPDLVVNSQPLYFGFKYPYGIQTLGVSARYVLQKNIRNWRSHRILFSLNNAEFYLKPKYFFTRRNFNYLRSRGTGGLSQLIHRVQIRRH